MKVDGRMRVRADDGIDAACGDYLSVVADVKEHFVATVWPFKSGLVNSRGNCLHDKLRRSCSVPQMERLTGIPEGAQIVTASPARARITHQTSELMLIRRFLCQQHLKK